MIRLASSCLVIVASVAMVHVLAGLAHSQDANKGNPYSNLMMNALFNRQVQQELALAEEQEVELKQLMASIQELRKEMGSQLKQFSQGATREEIDARRTELAEQFEVSKLESQAMAMRVLLPHQKERLGQLTARLMLRESSKKNEAGVLASEMKDYLGIDDEQAEKIRTKAAEIKKQLAEDIKKLNDQARDELMKELTPEQQKKYKKLIGDPFDG